MNYKITMRDLAYYLFNDKEIPYDIVGKPLKSLFRIIKTTENDDLKLLIAVSHTIYEHQNSNPNILVLIRFCDIIKRDTNENFNPSDKSTYNVSSIRIYPTNCTGTPYEDHYNEITDLDTPIITQDKLCSDYLNIEISMFLNKLLNIKLYGEIDKIMNNSAYGLTGVSTNLRTNYSEIVWLINEGNPISFVIDNDRYTVERKNEKDYVLTIETVTEIAPLHTHNFCDLDMVFSYILCSLKNVHIVDCRRKGNG